MSILGKWWVTMKVGWINLAAYKLNFLLFIIGPAVVFFFIKINLWTAVYDSNTIQLGSFSLEGMLAYQAWVLVVSLLTQSFNDTNLAEDIRLGRISAYLVYPFDFWQFHGAKFLANLSLQFGISLIMISLLVASSFIDLPNLTTLLKSYLLCLLIAFTWFTLTFMMGILSFWLDETWVLRVILINLTGFFSGSIIPLELFPSWLLDLIYYTPFPYLTSVPVNTFMQRSEVAFLPATLIISAWLIGFIVLARFLWHRGVRMYTAAGI